MNLPISSFTYISWNCCTNPWGMKTPSNRLSSIQDNRLKRYCTKGRICAQNGNFSDAKKYIMKAIDMENEPVLKENRNKLNTPQGYCALDGSNEVPRHIEYGSVNLFHVKKILLLSDGLQLIHIEGSGFKVWDETARFAFQHGLRQLEKTVTAMELDDPACFTYPRLKPADDKTGILIHFMTMKQPHK